MSLEILYLKKIRRDNVLNEHFIYFNVLRRTIFIIMLQACKEDTYYPYLTTRIPEMLVIQSVSSVPSPRKKKTHISNEPSLNSEILNNNKAIKFL
jgi:hypothetical protein